jgi:hypothetical protein
MDVRRNFRETAPLFAWLEVSPILVGLHPLPGPTDRYNN